MTYYWSHLIPADELRAFLSVKSWDYEVADMLNEPDSPGMRQSFPTYVHRRYRVYQNGSCVGYTSQAVIDELGLKPNKPNFAWTKESNQ